jgi:hypothetical protein
MEEMRYPYSSKQITFGVIGITGMIAAFIYLLIINISDKNAWIVSMIFILMMLVMAIFYFKKFVSPLLKGTTALELDKEKLQLFVFSTKTVYWKDVQYIDYEPLKYGGYSIRFAIKDSSENRKISTKFVAGDDADIYKKVSEYFEKYKVDDDFTRSAS